MNADELASLVRSVATAVLGSSAGAAYVSGAQATAIATGLGALVSVAWGAYAHWSMKKVPVSAVVVSAPVGK